MQIPHQLLEPWLITPEFFRGFFDERFKALMAKPGTPVEDCSLVEVRDDYPDTAIIHVKGPLFRYASWWGGTSYGQIRKDLQRVLDDSAFSSIIWNFDSPGGEVNGCAECADAIYAARGKKPTRVYVSGSCASGALWLASSAGELQCSPTAVIGSIGVIATLWDDTKALEEAGFKEFEIVASQSPKKSQRPADAGYRARVQQRLDDICDVFLATVARNYGMTVDQVLEKFGQGDVMVGARAVDAGLAAGISDFESVIAALASSQTTNRFLFPTGVTMDMKGMARLLKLDESASERQIEDRAQALAQFERDVMVATGSTDADAALGKARAGAEAIAERDRLKLEVKAKEDEAVKTAFRADLKAALKDGRVTLGQASKVIPTFLKDEEAEKALAALASIKEQSRKAVLDALCSVHISAKALVRMRAFIESQPASAVPAAKSEPADDDKNRQQVAATMKVSEQEAAKYGMKPEAFAKFANVSSVAEIERAQKAGV